MMWVRDARRGGSATGGERGRIYIIDTCNGRVFWLLSSSTCQRMRKVARTRLIHAYTAPHGKAAREIDAATPCTEWSSPDPGCAPPPQR